MACGSCQHHAGHSPVSRPLLQISSGYRAQWNNLALSVESDSSQWTLHVLDNLGSEALYTGHRCSASAAQRAAAEFAIVRVLGHDSRLSADSLVKALAWTAYW
jgi:uncharacterized Ntn-hydrolase superfamily protein